MTAATQDICATLLRSPDLPTLPVVANALLTLTAREDASLAEIAALIAQDVSLSAKMLRVANSSFYSFPRQIASIQQAVTILGINAVRSLALSFSFLSLRATETSSFDLTSFWEHSLIGATAARVIAEQVPGIDREEAFIAGLLKDVGQLVFACALPAPYEQLLANAANDPPDEAREALCLGITHSRAGYEVARQWGLPERHLRAIRHHHAPEAMTDEEDRSMVRVVALADHLAAIFLSPEPDTAHRRFRMEAKELLGLGILPINAILKRIDEEINAAASGFELAAPTVRSVAEILEEANQRLSRLNLSYEEMNRELIASKLQLEKLSAELQHKNSLLQNLASIDHLTEVANHRSFQTSLDRELQRVAINGGCLSLLFMDIDHFKAINDTHGHLQGDRILREFCRITGEIVRDYDTLARYGGEEFVLILPETTGEDAATVADKVRNHVENHLFCEGNGDIRLTVSIGIATARPAGEAIDKQTLVSRADEALYQAKRAGRNRVASYRPPHKKAWLRI